MTRILRGASLAGGAAFRTTATQTWRGALLDRRAVFTASSEENALAAVCRASGAYLSRLAARIARPITAARHLSPLCHLPAASPFAPGYRSRRYCVLRHARAIRPGTGTSSGGRSRATCRIAGTGRGMGWASLAAAAMKPTCGACTTANGMDGAEPVPK